MKKVKCSYVVYIQTTPEELWSALTVPEITTLYWQLVNVSSWKPGSKWEHRRTDHEGPLLLVGKIIEISPPNHLVISWANAKDEADKKKHSKVTFDIEPMDGIDGVVQLSVTHDNLVAGSSMHKGIAYGWPIVLSSLKTFLETGHPLPKLW